MKIVFFNRTGGACDYYRARLPLTTMARLGGHKAHEITKHEMAVGMAKDDVDKLAPLMDADAVLLPRLAERNILDDVKELNPKAKIILDYDDNVFAISPLSPHYVDHGTEDVRLRMPNGEMIDLWVDGKNIDLTRNRKMAEDVKAVLGIADVVTVTQPILAEAYRPYAKKIECVPNCVDLSIWNRLPLLPRSDLRVGWFGGSSHYEDWTLLTNVLPRVMDIVPEMRLVLMGVKFEGTLKKIDPKRIEFHPWVPTDAYPYKAAALDLDMALIPLRVNEFNACKSNIKWVEMSSLKIPSVVSMVSPYEEWATEDNGVWIEGNEKAEWVDGIVMLAKDAALRKSVGDAARATVEKEFDISRKWREWETIYNGVIYGDARPDINR